MRAFLETWRPVRGYEGLYQVSDYGDVRSFCSGKVRYMKKTKYSNGYEYLHLYRDGKSRHYRVHRLVWEAFNGSIPDGYEIDHVNGVKDDNRLANLRVVTPKENNHNPITRERHRDANRRRLAKPVLQLNKDTGEVLREWVAIADAGRELGINHRNISQCCNGNLKSTGGFRWRFK